ncbi:MAG: CmpA/NrtA family ABC transporter substrate-binding protein [Methylocella sp.]
MSAVISLTAVRKASAPKMRIGLLRLTDSAPVIAAYEFGFFADEGVDAELIVEPSWANIADKLAYGFFDAAVIIPPLAFNIHLGVRGAFQPLIIPCGISSGGNSVTVVRSLGHDLQTCASAEDVSLAEALGPMLRGRNLTFGVVHAYSNHSLLLRYWLATVGIEAGRDVALTVVPPARAVEALVSGQIAGFCAGAPWGEVARRAGVGLPIASSNDIWRNAPEKALAVRARWAEEKPETLAGVVRAIVRAAKFCDEPENAAYVAALLSRRKYVDIEPHAILADLPGGSNSENGCGFYGGATLFPWRSQGLWFLNEMRRWGLIDSSVDLHRLALRVYRPDLYRSAVASLGEPVPVTDSKIEGAHKAAWTVEASPFLIAMRADNFCDSVVFDPDQVAPPSATTRSAAHNF